jgi:maltooligosyltrehalose synthase
MSRLELHQCLVTGPAGAAWTCSCGHAADARGDHAIHAAYELRSEIDRLSRALDAATERAEEAEAERRERTDTFADCISDYERLRGYLLYRHQDESNNTQVARWLASNGHGLIVEGVPEADEWRERYWPQKEPADD